MSLVQVVIPSAQMHVRSLAQHVRMRQEGGAQVVFVTANRPYETVATRLREADVDPDAVFFIDAISCVDGFQPANRPNNTMFLQSPTMLEMIAMRTEQVVTRRPNAHVIIDSLNALALYNGVEPVQEFCHYLANRLRTRGVSADFVVLDNPQGQLLEERTRSFTDGRMELEAPA